MEFDFTFTIGNLITIISVLVGAAVGYVKLAGKATDSDKRLSVLESQVASLQVLRQDIVEIKTDLRWIRDMLNGRNK